MKIIKFLSIILIVVLPKFGYTSSESQLTYIGTLTVKSMHQGKLLWLDGRVGEAVYRYNDDETKTCSLILPVVIGNMSGSGIGIGETNGLTINIISQRLNTALINGERIYNSDWHFSLQEGGELDGVIVSGISEDENFILNSRRRWISWLSGKDNHDPVCV